MSLAVLISSLIIICRRFPLLVAELIIRIVDQIYRLFLDYSIEQDIIFLMQSDYQDVSLPHCHCWRAGEVEFYTTTFRIGAGSFSGWRMRVRYLPNVYVECAFGEIKEKGTLFWRKELADNISREIAFHQLAMKEAYDEFKFLNELIPTHLRDLNKA